MDRKQAPFVYVVNGSGAPERFRGQGLVQCLGVRRGVKNASAGNVAGKCLIFSFVALCGASTRGSED